MMAAAVHTGLAIVQGAVAGAHMVQTFAAAGLPPGVLNLVTGVQGVSTAPRSVRAEWLCGGSHVVALMRSQARAARLGTT